MVSFWENDVWSFVILISVLFTSMVLCNMLRATIKPLRQSMIPAAVLAGFLCLGLKVLWRVVFKTELFDEAILEALTYHGLGLGVAAMTFCRTKSDNNPNSKRDIFNSGILTVSTYLLQAVLGLAITIALYYIIGSWAASGVLLPMGYGQGPGNAYGWGFTYETATDYLPFKNGSDFGLSVAAMGFISASVGGVIYLQGVRKRKGVVDSGEMREDEQLSIEMFTEKGEIPVSDSVDKFSVQIGLVLFAYLLTYLFNSLVSIGLDAAGGFLQGTVKPLLWNFNFLVVMMFVAIIKGCRNLSIGKDNRRREYINNFMMSRISGFMFDMMVVASIAVIDLSAFLNPEFVVPLALICVVGGVATYYYVRFVCRKLFADYTDEQFLVFYGMLTGTNSTGFILLREIDPFYKTPASKNLIFQNLWAALFGAPMLLMLGIAPKSMTMTWVTFGAFVVFLAVMLLVLFRSVIFKKKTEK